jgi:hypothetical protein
MVPTNDGILLPPPQDLLDTMMNSGDPGAELAALAVKSGEAQQQISQQGRDAQEKMEADADDQQVADLRLKASDIRSAGAWEATGMMLEGGCALGGATQGAFTNNQNVSLAWQGGGKVMNGITMIPAAFDKGAQANDDANAAQAKSASDQAKSAADDLHDAKKTGGDLISAALDFYREYTSAQASASTAALHRA